MKMMFPLKAGALIWAAAVSAQTPQPISPGFYAAPSQGGVRRWVVSAPEGASLLARAALDARVITTLPVGHVLSNLGCTAVQSVTWCRVQPLRGGARGYVSATALSPAKGPDGDIALGRDDSEMRAGRGDFDAEVTIRCAQEVGEALGTCSAGIARGSGGDATVIATFDNGFARRLYFVNGAFVAANNTMSGSGMDVDWRVEGTTHVIRVDDQRFLIEVDSLKGG